MEPIDCPETSVRNYNYSLRDNSPEERNYLLLRGGGSLKLRFHSFIRLSVKGELRAPAVLHSEKVPQHPLYRRLGEPQSLPERTGADRHIFLLPAVTPHFLTSRTHSVVTV